VPFAKVAGILKERAEMDRKDPPNFSVFEALSPNENSLSSMLRFLFDANANHGQGPTFINAFLDEIGCRDRMCQPISVTTEFGTYGSRDFDILLVSRAYDYVIAIENKPWADEQERRLSDRANDLEHRWPGRSKLVFLTGRGREPVSAGGFEVKILRYDRLADILKTSCANIQPEPFLDEFKQYVREEIDMEPPVVAHTDAILKPMIEEFNESMLELIRPDFPDGKWCSYPRDSYLIPPSTGVFFFKSSWENLCGIGFNNAEANAQDMFFGINYVWEESPARYRPIAAGELREAIVTAFGVDGYMNPAWWEWKLELSTFNRDYQNWFEPKILKRMGDDGGKAMAEDLYPLVKKAIEVAGPYIDSEASKTPR
jgi:hypothetical protein